MEFEVLSWKEIHQMCVELTDRVRRSGFKPDIIVSIARGGWIPARIMSDLLENQNITSMKVEFYGDVAETKSKPVITQPIPISVKGKRLLVADDVADTGESLKLVDEHLRSLGAAEVDSNAALQAEKHC